MLLALTIAEEYDPGAPFILQGRPFQETIPLAADYGYKGVELQLRTVLQHNDPVIALCESKGIRIVSIATGKACADGLSLSSENAEVRSETIGLIKAHIDFSSQCSHHPAIMIGLLAGRTEKNGKTKESYTVLGSSLKEISDYAYDKNVDINLEPINHFDSNILNTWENTVNLLDQFQCDHIKIGLDLFHMRLEEKNIEETMQKYKNRIGSVQLMDDNRKAPGFGNFRFERFIQIIKESGYDGPIIMECLPVPDALSALSRAKEFYNTYF